MKNGHPVQTVAASLKIACVSSAGARAAPADRGTAVRLSATAAAMMAAVLVTAAGSCQAVDVRLWHAMSGPAGEKLNELVTRFNSEQHDVHVIPEYKGSYSETLESALAAARGGKGPDLVQGYDVATAALLADSRDFRPLHQVLSETGVQLDSHAFFPNIATYYSDRPGKLAALPLNTSTAVLLYNKDAFQRAGLDPEVPPRTWRDIQTMTLAIQSHQATPCGYTTDWQSWIHLENLAAWHNEAFATKANGLDGADARLNFNSVFMLRHISLLSAWSRSGLFTYAGRENKGESKFADGECAILTTSSASLGPVLEHAKFNVGVAPLPYYDEYAGAPYASMLGGAALWVMQGKKPPEYKGAARFLAFLSRPAVQAEWHQATGYLPESKAAYDLTREQGFYKKMPGYEVAIREMTGKAAGINARGVRLADFAKIRDIIDEELEQVWAQRKAPKDALDAAVARGNQVLQAFKAK